jgi:hypothetical protein
LALVCLPELTEVIWIRAMFRTPDDATPNRWAVLTSGPDIKDPERLGHDHEAFEQHVREVTNRDDIKVTRYHYLTAHQYVLQHYDDMCLPC